MPRLKPKNSIMTKDQAVDAMQQICEIDRVMAAYAMTEAEEIAKVREKHAEIQLRMGVRSMEGKKALLIRELEAWAKEDRANWPAKSITTSFGAFGFRTGNKAVALLKSQAKNLKEALENLQISLPQFIRRAPAIDMDAILAADRNKKLNHDVLNSCGLKVEQKETFWVETAASKDLAEAAKALKNA